LQTEIRMEKLPFVPGAPSRSAEDVRRELAELRRFHLGDPATRAEVVPHELLPALLHPHRDPRRLRSPFPVHVPQPADGVAARCTSIGDLLGTALLRSVSSPGQARLVADNLVRAERVVGNRIAASGGRADAAEVLEDVGARIAAELELSPANGAELAAQWAALHRQVPAGELLALDAGTGLRLLLAAARAVVPPRREALRAEVETLRARLRDLLEIERRKDPAAAGAEAVQSAVGKAGATMLDPAALARVVGRRAQGSLRVDPRRRARIEQALAVLDDSAARDPEPLLTLVHAPGRRPAVEDPQLRLCAEAAPCTAAARLFDGEAERQAVLFRALRLARLEVDGAYDPDRHDLWLEALDWQGFTDEELLLVPTIVGVEAAAELAASRLGELSQILRSGRPLQVLAVASPVEVDPVHGPLPWSRLELGYLGVSHREAFVQQATAARPDHLFDGFRLALTRPRTALHVVSTGLDAGNREPAIGAFLHAGAAIDARAHPLFRYDPDAGSTWARRLDFSGNPDVEADWAEGRLRRIGSGAAEEEVEVAFTFADFGLLDPDLAGEYRIVPTGLETPALVPVVEALADGGAHAVPFVEGVDRDGQLLRAVISRRLLAATRDRLDFWHTLQELAGVRNEYVREAVAAARDEAAAVLRAERERLEAALGAAVDRARDEAVARAMDGLARSLLELGPDAFAASPAASAATPGAGAARPPAATGSAGAGPAQAAASPAASEPPPEAEPAGEEPAFAEPWIDTVLCTSCNDCRNINPQLFVYDGNKQAMIGDPTAGTYRQLVTAAEKCPARCIHPGLPLNPDEPGLDELVARAAPFNR
jgi:ferredoxin